MIDIQFADLKNHQVAHLIKTHIDYGNAHYPEESNHHLTAEKHTSEEVQLFAAWSGESCLGMVGLKKLNNYSGELKSMHVLEGGRGLGVGTKLVEHVISNAKRDGLKTLFLETGSRNASEAARKLYEKLDFSYCAPFGDYLEDPESVFMVRSI